MMTNTNNDERERDFKEAVLQFLEAYLHGSTHDVEELVREYPEFEDQIRQKITEFQEVNTLFDFLSRADESDFEDSLESENLVGRKVGSFEITKIIGRGGMGVVYLAHDTKLKRSVAVKSIPVAMACDLTARTRFRREAELLASLNHPNIAVIHEIIEEEKSSYLILEYVPGETLAQRIVHEPLNLEEALSIARQVAEAVSAAHDKGIMHRDLKPGNIKITPDDRVKVLDFGLAKSFTSEGNSSEITETRPDHVIGTPAYMSPEQARGKPIDKRSDIWSFGCILYQMLTGQLPFEGETATDTIAGILEHQPDWEVLPRETPINIRTLLRRCLEKKPQQRLQDIGDAVIEINETQSLPTNVLQVRVSSKLRRMVMIIGVIIIVVLSTVAVQFILKKQTQPVSKEIRVVVLPFENLGSTEDEYFADGITDAITARLAGIHGLGVISRQSAIQYKKREKDARQIAQELRVDYILEGTVQRERPSDPTSRVRIIPQLIKASEDTHVWTDIYDDDMSEVFRLQSDIAERVAQALDITLLQAERKELVSRPTENLEAYDYYLRGNLYFHRSYRETDMKLAVQLYEKAVDLDPKFALAYAALSEVHTQIYWYHYDRSEKRLTMAEAAVRRALEINPGLPEGHRALGFYYFWGHLDYDRALEQFAVTKKSRPNDSMLWEGIGYVQKRQGKFEQALVSIMKADELNPRTSVLARQIGSTFMLLRKYKEAERYIDRAISLAPDLPMTYCYKAAIYVRAEGSTKKARAVLADALHSVKPAENFSLIKLLINIDVIEGNYQEALDRLSLASQDIDNQVYIDDQFNFVPNSLRFAEIYGYMDENELAKKYYEDARNILEAKIQERYEDSRFHSALGIVYAGLGRKEDAIREGQRGVELLPISRDAWRGPCRVEDLARIYVMVGEHKKAIEKIEYLLSIPGPLSIHQLQLSPAWNPLLTYPRFKKLIESDR